MKIAHSLTFRFAFVAAATFVSVSLAVSLPSCKVRHHQSQLAADSLKWSAKKEIYDFSKICPLKSLEWHAGTKTPDEYLSDVIAGSTTIQKKIEGKESGVVVSTDGASRQFFEKIFPSCGPKAGGITLRFSVDRIPGNEYAYEMFIKDNDTDEVIGLAFNSKGEELTEVPEELAFDKDGLKKKALAERAGDHNFDSSKIVRSRLGCFSCHASISKTEDDEKGVSEVYGIGGTEGFWGDAKIVEFLTREKLAKSTQQPSNPTIPEKANGTGSILKEGTYVCVTEDNFHSPRVIVPKVENGRMISFSEHLVYTVAQDGRLESRHIESIAKKNDSRGNFVWVNDYNDSLPTTEFEVLSAQSYNAHDFNAVPSKTAFGRNDIYRKCSRVCATTTPDAILINDIGTKGNFYCEK